ncbi:MAG: sterol desaturase family protein [Alphaproteobacteria bacterium]|nr:sterol desaturase family protein [Alphaproteobacteria bacterium]
MAVAAYGFALDHPVLYFNLAYLFLIVSLYFLERFMPHEAQWLQPDGQTFANIAHTLTSKGTVQGLLLFSSVIGLADLITSVAEPGYGLFGVELWPRHWPMVVQATLGVVAAEFALYWAHRLAHEWPFLWRFHAIHHSVTKLWFVNTGRFHFIDSLVSIVLGMSVLLALGAPMEVVKWQAVITAFIGMLTHCNVEMRFGPLSWIFNTPGLHRWHHSKDLREGNKNYGENIMLWDQLFRTYFNENRRPPVDIGISEYMPPKFTHQLLWPFLSERAKRALMERSGASHASE